VANVSGEGLVAVAKMVEGACLQLVCLPFPFLFKITRISIAEKFEMQVYPPPEIFSTGKYPPEV